MPLVFSSEVKHYLPEEWYKHILNKSQDYESLRVVTLTRVKNLDSAWGHEYIQFIVEDELSNERARVYAERGVPKSSIDAIATGVTPITFGRESVDGVTIGFDEKGEKGRWNGPHDLPLPLESYIYTAKKPSFISLAETISWVSKKGGSYKPIGNNCYWFAYTAMNDYGEKNKGTPKTVYATIGGRGGGGLRDIISYHKFRLRKEYYRVSNALYSLLKFGLPDTNKFLIQKDAEKFNKERRDGGLMDALTLSRGYITSVKRLKF
ncbi:hypothetical protein PENSUB_4805 [Penicillium subrubescens]|uniref:Uncharacterized protein n=1 Tax=Penicillium subrubescens TaxID=1316194 RepID=A0A1Q5UBE9_9EURO|nr:hypothetical protein PENSUB_4805 [Penicillium subrubescens]